MKCTSTFFITLKLYLEEEIDLIIQNGELLCKTYLRELAGRFVIIFYLDTLKHDFLLLNGGA